MQLRTYRNKPKTTLGKINKTIDVWLHPLAEENPLIWIVDGMLHSAVEYYFKGQNVKKSVNKFVEYNLIPLLQSIEDHANDPSIIPFAVVKILEYMGVDMKKILQEEINRWL